MGVYEVIYGTLCSFDPLSRAFSMKTLKTKTRQSVLQQHDRESPLLSNKALLKVLLHPYTVFKLSDSTELSRASNFTGTSMEHTSIVLELHVGPIVLFVDCFLYQCREAL